MSGNLKVTNSTLEVFRTFTRVSAKQSIFNLREIADVYFLSILASFFISFYLKLNIPIESFFAMSAIIGVLLYGIGWLTATGGGHTAALRAIKSKETVNCYDLLTNTVYSIRFSDVRSVTIDNQTETVQDKFHYQKQHGFGYETITTNERTIVTWFVEIIDSTERTMRFYHTANEEDAKEVGKAVAGFLNRPLIHEVYHRTIEAEDVTKKFVRRLLESKTAPMYPEQGDQPALTIKRQDGGIAVIAGIPGYNMLYNTRFIKLLIEGILGGIGLFILLPGIREGYIETSLQYLLLIFLGIVGITLVMTYLQENNPESGFLITRESITIQERKGIRRLDVTIPLEQLNNIVARSDKSQLEISTDSKRYALASYLDELNLKYLERSLKAAIYDVIPRSSNE